MFNAGKAGVFKLDNAAGALQNISAFLNKVDFPREVGEGETTTFGVDDRTYIATLKSATITLAGFFDPAAGVVDEILSGILGHASTKSFEYGPAGSGAGFVKYSGEAICTAYQTSNPVDGVVPFTATLRVSGPVARGVWP